MKGLGRVLSWVGQDLPSDGSLGPESQRELDLAELAGRLLKQGGLSADDEATLELVCTTIQSARVERGLADQSASALRLELKTIQEELVASRTELSRISLERDETAGQLHKVRGQLEQTDLARAAAKKASDSNQASLDEHIASIATLRGELSETKATEKATRGNLNTSLEAERTASSDLEEAIEENAELRTTIDDAKNQLQAGEMAFSSAQVELSRELAEARKMRAEAETGLHDTEKRANRAEERANRAEEQVLRAKERALRAEEVSRHLDEVAVHSKRRVEENKTSQTELEAQLAAAEAARSEGEEQLKIVRGKLEELNAGQLGEEASIDNLDEVISTLGHGGGADLGLSSAPEPVLSLLRGLLNRLRSELELGEQMRGQLESKTIKLESEENSRRRQVAELEAQRARLESELREAQQQLDDLEREADEVTAERTSWRSRAEIAEGALQESETRAVEAEARAAKAKAASVAVDEWEELARLAEQRALAAEEKNAVLETQHSNLQDQQRRAESRASLAEETAIRSAMEAERAAGAGEKALEALGRYEERCRRADERAEDAHKATRAATAKKAAAEVLAAQARQRVEAAEQHIRELQADALERSQRLETLEASLSERLMEAANARNETTAARHKRDLVQKQLGKLEEELEQKDLSLSEAQARELSTDQASLIAVEAARAEMRAKLENELAEKERVLQDIRGELAEKERSVAEQLAEADGKVALVEQARDDEIRKLQVATEERQRRRTEDVVVIRAELSALRSDHDKLLGQTKATAGRESLAQQALSEARSALKESEQERQKVLDTLNGMEDLERERIDAEKAQAEDAPREPGQNSEQAGSSPGFYRKSFRKADADVPPWAQTVTAVETGSSTNDSPNDPSVAAPYQDKDGELDDPAGVSIEIESTDDGAPPGVPGLDELLEELDASEASFDNSDGKIHSAKRDEEGDNAAFSFFRKK
jgi:trichohyalin